MDSTGRAPRWAVAMGLRCLPLYLRPRRGIGTLLFFLLADEAASLRRWRTAASLRAPRLDQHRQGTVSSDKQRLFQQPAIPRQDDRKLGRKGQFALTTSATQDVGHYVAT